MDAGRTSVMPRLASSCGVNPCAILSYSVDRRLEDDERHPERLVLEAREERRGRVAGRQVEHDAAVGRLLRRRCDGGRRAHREQHGQREDRQQHIDAARACCARLGPRARGRARIVILAGRLDCASAPRGTNFGSSMGGGKGPARCGQICGAERACRVGPLHRLCAKCNDPPRLGRFRMERRELTCEKRTIGRPLQSQSPKRADGGSMGSAEEPRRTFVFSFGLERLGLLALKAPTLRRGARGRSPPWWRPSASPSCRSMTRSRSCSAPTRRSSTATRRSTSAFPPASTTCSWSSRATIS